MLWLENWENHSQKDKDWEFQTWTNRTDEQRLAFPELLLEPKNIWHWQCQFEIDNVNLTMKKKRIKPLSNCQFKNQEALFIQSFDSLIQSSSRLRAVFKHSSRSLQSSSSLKRFKTVFNWSSSCHGIPIYHLEQIWFNDSTKNPAGRR